MADLVKAVDTMKTMLRMRDTARALWGAKYPAKVAEWQDAIRLVADGKGLDPLKAAMELMAAADKHPIAVLAITASYVELVEPFVVGSPCGMESACAQ